MNTTKLILYPHGGSGNHGCEAIVRSTLKITQAEATLFSNAPQEDIKYGLGAVCDIRQAQLPLSHGSLLYWKAFSQYHTGDKEAFDRATFRPIFEAASQADYALSIGGDNYCYDAPAFVYLINKQLRKMGVKTVLWGCSIEPDSLQGHMLEDLKGYTHIYARESITYEALREKGIKDVSLFPDPAFQLGRVDLPLPPGFDPENTVGINVSPMIIGYERARGMTLQNYTALIRHLIRETDMQIALIPHVVWTHNDDRQPLHRLYDSFRKTGRVILIEDHNAEELKGYIARCRFMVVARTHASIAAYSEQVPTLVVGYSVKARGIARDLFGTEKDYVIPVQSLQKKEDLLHAFQWLVRHETEIRTHYQSVIPNYKSKALAAIDILK